MNAGRTFAFALLALVTLGVGTATGHAAQPIEDGSLKLPRAGDYGIRIIRPDLLELTIITSPAPGETPVPLPRRFTAGDFSVFCDGAPVQADGVGFKRRVLYAPMRERDLRVATEIYLTLRRALPRGAHTVKVMDVRSPLWPKGLVFTATTDPLRYSPALHVNQEGYTPEQPKIAMVGYYLGSLGELDVPTEAGFDIVAAGGGKPLFHGELRRRRDIGFTTMPPPYQQVYEADFTNFRTLGEYRLRVPGLGASLPFRIAEGEVMNFARAYALGLYHQRCGVALELPFTRFTHAACHTAPADVPVPADQFTQTWNVLASAANDKVRPERPDQQIRSIDDLHFPYLRQGKIDVSGGHHDAGDYSKYLINSASLVHYLIFAVDAFPGVADLDNLGLPESGDGVSDLLEEAKLESDFIARMQDEDGGFYFLVYPRERRYENDVLPDQGDPQVVWPKTTSVTAAAVAALAQCASSPEFRHHYPDVAKRYLAQAQRGWKFLLNAIDRYGEGGAYQRLTHYGDDFEDRDELAWAAAELFVATGDRGYEQKLEGWYPDPADPRTMQWGWRRASFSYGNALRAYAFADRTGRLSRGKLDAGYLERCEAELRRAGDDAERDAERNAYGVSYPEASKRINAAGWFFASDEAFDLTVAYQLRPRGAYEDAVFTNLDYEAGCNPVNRVFITGLGQQRQREIVDQYAQNDDRVLPPSGLPIGCLQSQFDYLDHYGSDLRNQSFPSEDQYPLYDRWSDAYNVTTEFVVVNQARSLASLAFWAAQTSLKAQPWRAARATIGGIGHAVRAGRQVTVHLECPSLDLSEARIVWEARDAEPAFGRTFTFVPRDSGPQWVEAEAALPDGRRVFARSEFRVNAPVVLWIDGELPSGATPTARGGDTWDWRKPETKPSDLAAYRNVPQHESALASGIHDHGFNNAREPLDVQAGDFLFAYVFIDPQHPPRTIMLEWNDGSYEHRAYWGPNLIPWGKPNGPGQREMGPIPPAGRWVRLDVPARAVALEGREVKGMSFRLYDGRVRWDAAGKMSAAAHRLLHLPVPPSPANPTG